MDIWATSSGGRDLSVGMQNHYNGQGHSLVAVSFERVLNVGGDGPINALCVDMAWKNHFSNYIIPTTWNRWKQNQDLCMKATYFGAEDLSLTILSK